MVSVLAPWSNLPAGADFGPSGLVARDYVFSLMLLETKCKEVVLQLREEGDSEKSRKSLAGASGSPASSVQWSKASETRTKSSNHCVQNGVLSYWVYG